MSFEYLSRGEMKKRGLKLGLIMLLFTAAAGTLNAQFSGPALQLPAQPNQPLVPNNDPSLLQTPSPDITISAGDLLSVHVFEATDFSPVAQVSAEGTVQLPLIGPVHVAGLTVHQAEDAIASRLVSAGMYKSPQVTIDLTQSANQYATVTGELHALVPLVGVRRLVDVLAIAGGTAPPAAGAISTRGASAAGGFPSTASHVITIIREGVPKPIVVNLGTDPAQIAQANIIILPHDVIVVSRVGVVYMVGAFNRQGAILLDQNSPLTLMQAASLTGGLGFEGRYEKLAIIRTEGLDRKVIHADIKRILHGKDPDPILAADDIVFLPTNALKAALKGGGIAAVVGLADVALLAINR